MGRSPLVLGAGLLLVVVLAGCAAHPPVTRASAAGVPAFPRIAGAVIATSQPVAGDWLVRVRVADPHDAYGRARSLLTAHGYQLTSDEPGSDGGHGQACMTALCVNFSTTGASGAGVTVDYEVFHSTGMSG